AVTVAEGLSDRFDGGVHIVELSGLVDDDDVAGSVARQLGATSLDGFRLRASRESTLVVLDNCESALTASRSVAGDLVDSRVTVLATSRSPLYATSERVVAVRPLVTPAEATSLDGESRADTPSALESTPAEKLFLIRAAEAGATWARSPANLAAVRRLVRRLSGLPLAIELAAARSRVLGPIEMVERFDDHLDVLVRPGRSSARHQSLRFAIASSYEPLDDDLKTVFRSLSFLPTSFDLRIAHAVVGRHDSQIETLDAVTELVDASLVEVRETAVGTTEYLLLDSIRAFGREQMSDDERAGAGQRYVDEITAWAGETVAAALESFSPTVIAAIRDNTRHLVHAISWCLDHDPEPTRTYQMSLLFYGPTGATDEIAELATRIRARWEQNAPLQAESFAVMGSLTYRVGRYADGAELAARAVEHPDATAMATFMGNRTLGYEAGVRRDSEAAIHHIETAMAFGSAFSAAFEREIRISRAVMDWDASGSPAAIALLRQVIDESAAAEEWINVVWARSILGYHHRLLGDLEAARNAVELTVDIAQRSGSPWALFTAHHALAVQTVLDGSWPDAAGHFLRALETATGIGDIDSTAVLLRSATGAAAHLGETDVAIALCRNTPPGQWALVPPSRFEADELALRQRHAPVPGEPVDELVRRARDVLQAAEGRVPPSSVSSTSSVPSTVQATESPVYSFDGCELDTNRCELRRDGERVAIEPQVYDVLLYLVERRGNVVTKNELLDEVWGDRFVSEAALSSRVSAARRAVGDDGKAQHTIRTVHGKGFLFVAEVDGDAR
ncbi:MAG: winged helix-turn-helix domain-containing protein, partial [Actinomycetota bacterium]